MGNVVAKATPTADGGLKRVPQWVVDCITAWKARLLLHEWETQTMLDPDPGGDGDGDCRASVQLYPDYVTAIIKIRDDVPADLGAADSRTAETWQRDVIHELVHIRLGRLTHLVEDEFLSDYSMSQRQILMRSFRREVEPAVEILASILYSLAEEVKEAASESRNERQASKKVGQGHPGPLHPANAESGEKAGGGGA